MYAYRRKRREVSESNTSNELILKDNQSTLERITQFLIGQWEWVRGGWVRGEVWEGGKEQGGVERREKEDEE